MTIRLYHPASLTPDAVITLRDETFHYIAHVMRNKENDILHFFNATHGEWAAKLVAIGKRDGQALLLEQVRPPYVPSRRVHAVLAPIKPKRLEMSLEKLTELGVTDFHFIITERTQVREVNTARIGAFLKEATEQCERLDLPTLYGAYPLTAWIASQLQEPISPTFFLGHERAGDQTPKVLADHAASDVAFIVGPEGGFTPQEFELFAHIPTLQTVTLGNHILRAETAAMVFASFLLVS